MSSDISLYEANPEQYEKYQSLRPDYSQAIETVISMAQKHTQGNLSVADFCCGTGSISKRISLEVSPLEKLDLIDINPTFLEIAKSSGIKTASIQTHCSDILETNLPADHNLVLSVFAYHHVPDSKKSAYIAKAKQCLLPGGILILAEIFLPTKDDCADYYNNLYASIPKEQKTPGLESFLMETAQSENFEFKVSKEFSDNQFKGAGFELIDEVKIWPSTNDHKGTYVQTYKLLG